DDVLDNPDSPRERAYSTALGVLNRILVVEYLKAHTESRRQRAPVICGFDLTARNALFCSLGPRFRRGDCAIVAPPFRRILPNAGARMSTIQVDLGTRSYSIHVGNGLIHQAGPLVKSLHSSQRTVVISSRTILSLHGDHLLRSLARAGLQVGSVIIPE